MTLSDTTPTLDRSPAWHGQARAGRERADRSASGAPAGAHPRHWPRRLAHAQAETLAA